MAASPRSRRMARYLRTFPGSRWTTSLTSSTRAPPQSLRSSRTDSVMSGSRLRRPSLRPAEGAGVYVALNDSSVSSQNVPARPEPGRAEPAVANHEVDCRPRHAEYLSHLREAAKAPLIVCVFGRRHRSHCGGLLRANGGCGPWVLCGPSAPCAHKATMLGRWLSMSSASSGVTGWTADRTQG